MKIIDSCRVCKSKNIVLFFDLGEQPLANSLLKTEDAKEYFYSLSLSHCKDCGLVQLNETIDPKELFSEYVWVTGTSKVANEFSEVFFREITSRTQSPRQNYVLEIASNDGTFLLPFLKEGYQVLGVDPAKNIAEMAERENNIPTKCCFFGIESAKEILKEEGPAQIVFARNVLPHVANTRDFVEGMAECLADDGTLAIEAHYAKKILDELHYDSIYHEHLCYFTFKSLERLLNDFGLHVFDIALSPISGGSMVVYAKKRKVQESDVVRSFREKEKESKINEFESWKKFADDSFSHREKLLAILDDAKKKGGSIAGYGASARSSTLLNFCSIDSSTVFEIADANPLKQRLFTAGTHILISNPTEVMKKNPAYILLLAWNFADEIISLLKDKYNYRGGVIIPLPNDPRIIESI